MLHCINVIITPNTGMRMVMRNGSEQNVKLCQNPNSVSKL